MNFVAILKVLGLAAQYIPTLIQVGENVVPLVAGIRGALDQIGSSNPQLVTDAQFQAVTDAIAPHEAELDADIAAWRAANP